MNLFKPAEIRAILILSILVLLGSFLTLLIRQGKISSLDLGILINSGRYNYTYKIDSKNRANSAVDNRNGSNAVKDSLIEKSVPDEKIDLNTAGYFDLQALPGIGPALAERIISYRDSVGKFQSVEELQKVKGIGKAKLAGIKPEAIVR